MSPGLTATSGTLFVALARACASFLLGHRTKRPGLINESLRDLQAKSVTLHLHAEALGSADVDVVLRQIHAVASFVRAQRFDGREDRGHAGLVLDLLEQLLADQKRLDAFLNDLSERPRDHEGRVLDVQRVRDGKGAHVWFGVAERA